MKCSCQMSITSVTCSTSGRSTLAAPDVNVSKRRLPAVSAVGGQDHAAQRGNGKQPQTLTSVQLQRRMFLTGLALSPALLSMGLHGPNRASASPAGPRPGSLEVLQAVEDAFTKTMPKSKAPVMLRLVFHDAGTYSAALHDGGANASVRFELDRPENKGLKRGWNVIADTMLALQGSAAEGQVSYADLIALAGARAVRMCAGPSIPVPIGRVDAAAPDPESRLPLETFSADELLASFAAKGLSAQEMVVLSGSHVLGAKGFGDDPLKFDNVYYKVLLKKPWVSGDSMAQMIGLPSDHVLPDNAVCRPIIERYAADQAAFFQEFAGAYVKMTQAGAVWA